MGGTITETKGRKRKGNKLNILVLNLLMLTQGFFIELLHLQPEGEGRARERGQSSQRERTEQPEREDKTARAEDRVRAASEFTRRKTSISEAQNCKINL